MTRTRKQRHEDIRMLETGRDLLAACSDKVLVRGVIQGRFHVTSDTYENFFQIWVVTADMQQGKVPCLVQLHYGNELPVLYGGHHAFPIKEVVLTTGSVHEIEQEAEKIIHRWKGDGCNFPAWWFRPDQVVTVQISEFPMNKDTDPHVINSANVASLIEYHRLYTYFVWWRETEGRLSHEGLDLVLHRLQHFVCDQLRVWQQDSTLHRVPVL